MDSTRFRGVVTRAAPSARAVLDGPERRSLADAIRALRDCDAPEAAGQAIATGARAALGARSAALLSLELGRVRLVASAGSSPHEPGSRLDVYGAIAATLGLPPAAPGAARPAHPAPSDDPELGPANDVAVPVYVDERLWGALTADFPEMAPAEAADVLLPFAELMGLTLATQETHRRLTTLAGTDPLTGLPNRRAFDAALGKAVREARRAGTALSVAVLDLDRFKAINDRLGHKAGDRVLMEAGQRLADAARAGDFVARIGGEEFGWILPGQGTSIAAVAVERARQRVARGRYTGAGRLTISAGVADLTDARTAQDMLELADAMLYQAKAAGRDAVRPRVRPLLVGA